MKISKKEAWAKGKGGGERSISVSKSIVGEVDVNECGGNKDATGDAVAWDWVCWCWCS